MTSLTIFGSRVGLDGRQYVRSEIQDDTTPDPMPHTGVGIDGISNDAALDVGSRLTVLDTSTEYVLGEDWNWYEWRTSSGGGGGGDTGELVASLSASVEPGDAFDVYKWTYTRANGTVVPVATQQVPNRAGVTFLPHTEQTADDRLTISWTNDGGLENPESVTIIAPVGARGEKGEAGADGFDPIITAQPFNGGWSIMIITSEGEQTITLADGRDGVSPTVDTEATDDGVTVTITAADGPHVFELKNGPKGESGKSAVITAERLPADQDAGLPDRVMITTHDSHGTTEATLYDGRDGHAPTVSVERVNDNDRIALPRGAKITVTLPDGTVAGETYIYDGVTPTISMVGTADIGGETISIPATDSGSALRPNFTLDFSAMASALAAAGGGGTGIQILVGDNPKVPSQYTHASFVAFLMYRSSMRESKVVSVTSSFYWGNVAIPTNDTEFTVHNYYDSDKLMAYADGDKKCIGATNFNAAGKYLGQLSGHLYNIGDVYAYASVIIMTQDGEDTLILVRN